jgi:hypothetical protein
VNDRLLDILVCLLTVLGTTPAPAWTDVGHRFICEIGFRELNERTREHPTKQALRLGTLITQRPIEQAG